MFKFRSYNRLHLNKEFNIIFKNGKYYKNSTLAMYVYEYQFGNNTKDKLNCRLGLIVSRKLGSSVARNKLKRRLREIFRLNKHLINKKVDMLFLPKKEAIAINYNKLQEVVLNIYRKAKLI